MLLAPGPVKAPSAGYPQVGLPERAGPVIVLSVEHAIPPRRPALALILYGIRNCDTMKKAFDWLEQRKVAF